MKVNCSLVSILAVALAGLALPACGGPEYCSGNSCACPANETCAFEACDPSTPNCQLACDPGSTCSGKCGAKCSVSCSGKSCTVEAGEGSSISCSAGACNITCTGNCAVAGLDVKLTCTKGSPSTGGCGESSGTPGTGELPGTGGIPGMP